MKKCTVCGTKFNESKLVKSVLNERELTILQKIRARKVVCNDCRMDMLLLNII